MSTRTNRSIDNLSAPTVASANWSGSQDSADEKTFGRSEVFVMSCGSPKGRASATDRIESAMSFDVSRSTIYAQRARKTAMVNSIHLPAATPTNKKSPASAGLFSGAHQLRRRRPVPYKPANAAPKSAKLPGSGIKPVFLRMSLSVS